MIPIPTGWLDQAAVEARRVLVRARRHAENQLGSARTVGEVWRINERIAELDAQLDAAGENGHVWQPRDWDRVLEVLR